MATYCGDATNKSCLYRITEKRDNLTVNLPPSLALFYVRSFTQNKAKPDIMVIERQAPNRCTDNRLQAAGESFVVAEKPVEQIYWGVYY